MKKANILQHLNRKQPLSILLKTLQSVRPLYRVRSQDGLKNGK